MTDHRFVTVDVFTDVPFGGNPLAVFPDARALTAAQMQRIAAEINYAETTFVLPPADPAHTAHVRIFTPRHEIPFAGHPNVGTGFVLASSGAAKGDRLVFEEAAGLVEIAIERRAGAVTGARIRAPQPLSTGAVLSPEEAAACLSLAPADIAVGTHPPTVASVGLPFLIVELRDRAALKRATPQAVVMSEFDRKYPRPGDHFAVHCYAPAEAGADCDFHVRVFVPLSGINEDPATGSANAALVALRASVSRQPELQLVVRQGDEIDRPSRLRLQASPAGVTVAGDCVPMIEGTIRL